MGQDYATQGFDVTRCGWNPKETVLTVASVKASLHLLFKQPVDGQIYAQPLYAENLQMPDGAQHNVLFVATEAASVYAFDADTNAGVAADPLWHVSLLTNGETTVDGKRDLDGCDNLDPQVGITATPVLDVANLTLYVVTKSKSDVDFHCRIHALDMTTGNEQPNSPADIVSDNFDPRWHNNRAGLLLNDGRLYIAFGAHCDRGIYHGWVMSYDAQQMTQLAAFDASPGAGQDEPGSGIWQCGIGLSCDQVGNVYCSTGNGAFTANTPGGQDYGNSVLKLSPDLALIDYFTPFNQENLNDFDWDLGSGGVVVLPHQTAATYPHMAVVCGKQGIIYLLDRDANMGKYNGTEGPDWVIQSIALYPDRVPTGPGRPAGSDASTPGVYGAPCYYAGPVAKRMYFCGSNGPIKAFTLDNDALVPHTLDDGAANESRENYMGQVDENNTPSAAGGCTPTVSSNENLPGTGVLWAVTRHGPQILRAYDAEDLTAPIFEGEAGLWNNVHGAPFAVPTVVNGKVYVGTSDSVAVFGL